MRQRSHRPKRFGHFLFTLLSVLLIGYAHGKNPFTTRDENYFQTEIVVRGTVYDPNNRPVEGASVNVKDVPGKGTTTNAAGEFTITVQQGNVLLISFIGHETQEVAINNNNPVSVVLVPGDQSLNAVIVTALGIKKEKRKVAYAAQEVKGKELEKARESNVLSNLTGKVAGLTIITKSTLFENPEVTLRGGNTLVVIDGIPTSTDFWNINPDDIDNITVLKGTAATTLYGSLGINGAIMITTKKGKAGANGVEVTFNSTNQFQAGFLRIPETQTDYGMGWAGQYSYLDGRGGGDSEGASTTAAAGNSNSNKKDDVVIEDIGDEPINLDDIPF